MACSLFWADGIGNATTCFSPAVGSERVVVLAAFATLNTAPARLSIDEWRGGRRAELCMMPVSGARLVAVAVTFGEWTEPRDNRSKGTFEVPVTAHQGPRW
mmetsp:Transcript_4591/g.10819  ORF Transcript_4591/g.10819 Transcript_4591/m.10819 type:complete len:101 (+) Transcript_4591:185-487(+)